MGRPPDTQQGRGDIRIMPLKPWEMMETLDAIRDVQADVATHFSVLLSSPSSQALERLSEARQREQEVFKTILGQDIPAWQRNGTDRRKAVKPQADELQH